jgi:hypothetical protein
VLYVEMKLQYVGSLMGCKLRPLFHPLGATERFKLVRDRTVRFLLLNASGWKFPTANYKVHAEKYLFRAEFDSAILVCD